MEKALLSTNPSKMKESCTSYEHVYPWPPRHYTCSFCQREFKSAQALGGHMNIHRRDRARLIHHDDHHHHEHDQHHKHDDISNPNPNPNLPVSSCNTNLGSNDIKTHESSLVSLSLSSFPSPSPPTKTGLKNDSFLVLRKLKDFSYEDYRAMDDGIRVSKIEEVVKLDLELGFSQTKDDLDLDLELRLGSKLMS